MRDNIDFRAGGSEVSGTSKETVSDVTQQFEQLLLHSELSAPPEVYSEFIRLQNIYEKMFLPSEFAMDRVILPSGLADPEHTDGKAKEARLWGNRRVRNRIDLIKDIRTAGTFIERVSMLLGVITTIANLFYACWTDEDEEKFFPNYKQLGEYVIPMFQGVLAIDIANNKFSFKRESFSELAVRVLKKTGNLKELYVILRNIRLIINMEFLDFLPSIPVSLEAPYYDQKATFQEVCRQCLAALCHQITVETKQENLLLTRFKKFEHGLQFMMDIRVVVRGAPAAAVYLAAQNGTELSASLGVPVRGVTVVEAQPPPPGGAGADGSVSLGFEVDATPEAFNADAFAASLADKLGVDRSSLVVDHGPGTPFKIVGSNEIMLYVSPIYYDSFNDDSSLVCEQIRKDLSLPSEDMVSYPKRETSVKGKRLNFEGLG